MKKYFSVERITKLAMLTAVAVVLFALEFPIFPAAPYLRLNFSDMPSLIASFMYGPVAGIIVTSIKVLLGMLFGITKDFGIGDLANMIVGILYVVPAGLIYAQRKTIKRAILCLVISSIVMVLGACIANLFVLMPLYGIAQNVRLELVISVYLPFNAIKAVCTSVLTFIVYKPLHRLFNLIHISRDNTDKGEYRSNSVKQTMRIAERMANDFTGGETVILSGELGAGKTHFTKGIGKALGIKEEITSPTFAIHKTYKGKLLLQHFDFYRLTEEESCNLGFEEIIGRQDSVSVIEWPQNAPALIPQDYIAVTIDRDGDVRVIRIERI